MLTTAEIVRSVYGAWRLAHADPDGMRFFDATPEGFWRSFRVAILLLPAYGLLLLLEYSALSPDGAAPLVLTGPSRLIAVELIAYAIGWVAFPLAAYYVAAAIGREREYLGYIVALNWSAVLQIGIFVPISAIEAWRLLPAFLDGTLFFAGTLALLVYGWFIARTALNISGLAAAGFVALDLALGVLLQLAKNPMIYQAAV